MKKLILIGALFAGCSDDDVVVTGNECGAGTTEVDGECVADAVCGAGTTLTAGMCLPTPPAAPVFRQVEHLARPGINEALLLTDAFLEGYNATAPSFAGVPSDVLTQVVAEAQTVLKAIYLGSCLVSGVLGLGTADSLDPGLVQCVEVGGNIFVGGNALTGTTLTNASAAQAQVYADRMVAQFVPDVMRVDTAKTSGYLTPCGTPTDAKPLLCGGRLLDDDVIDVTYNYLIGGLAGTAGGPSDDLAGQVRALTSDGVAFDTGQDAGDGNNKNGLTDGDPDNKSQGHPAVTTTFPYSAAPL